MNARDRFLKVLNFEKIDDRLPMVEWAAWWSETIQRWESEGLSKGLSFDQSLQNFGLDIMTIMIATATSDKCPQPTSVGGPIITDEKSYDEIRSTLFTDSIIDNVINTAVQLKERHDNGEIIIRLWLDGFFWLPRVLFGIENHLLAFYDYPELIHRINSELADFNIRVIDALFPILKPDMVGMAEDMSYNNGPMLSYDLFK